MKELRTCLLNFFLCKHTKMEKQQPYLCCPQATTGLNSLGQHKWWINSSRSIKTGFWKIHPQFKTVSTERAETQTFRKNSRCSSEFFFTLSKTSMHQDCPSFSTRLSERKKKDCWGTKFWRTDLRVPKLEIQCDLFFTWWLKWSIHWRYNNDDL